MFPVDAIQLLQAAFGKARIKNDVQEATMTFFNVLLEEFQPGFFVRDTSSRGLKNPMAKPDIILLAESEASRLLHPPALFLLICVSSFRSPSGLVLPLFLSSSTQFSPKISTYQPWDRPAVEYRSS